MHAFLFDLCQSNFNKKIHNKAVIDSDLMFNIKIEAVEKRNGMRKSLCEEETFA